MNTGIHYLKRYDVVDKLQEKLNIPNANVEHTPAANKTH